MRRGQWMRRTRTMWLNPPGQWVVGYRHPGDPGFYTILYRGDSCEDCEGWRQHSPAPPGDRPESQESER